jgi:glutamate synthase domain-containing protein 2
MHIAHSNIVSIGPAKEQTPVAAPTKYEEFATRMALKGHRKAVKNFYKTHQDELAEIRKYFPGWEPKFNQY